jgi:hypothetical protein
MILFSARTEKVSGIAFWRSETLVSYDMMAYVNAALDGHLQQVLGRPLLDLIAHQLFL